MRPARRSRLAVDVMHQHQGRRRSRDPEDDACLGDDRAGAEQLERIADQLQSNDARHGAVNELQAMLALVGRR